MTVAQLCIVYWHPGVQLSNVKAACGAQMVKNNLNMALY